MWLNLKNNLVLNLYLKEKKNVAVSVYVSERKKKIAVSISEKKKS